MKTRVQIVYASALPLNINFPTESEAKECFDKLNIAAQGKLTVLVEGGNPCVINMANFQWMGLVEAT